VEAETINTFKDRLDKHWSNQDVLFKVSCRHYWNWKSTDLYVILYYSWGGQRPTYLRPSERIGLDWIVR